MVLGGRVHVFENVRAVHRQQDLVHFEDVLRFERKHFENPGIGSDGNHALAGEILRAFDTESGFIGRVALVILGRSRRHPGGFDVLLLGHFLDFLDVEGCALP